VHAVTTETLDKLYLEWSQFTKARTGREIEMGRALAAILAEPHGCVFCDSGKLRNPDKQHEITCGFDMARAALGING
jgi:hypothetical protein